MDFFLLAFPALFSIINPLGGAFVFLSATANCLSGCAIIWRAGLRSTAF